MTSFLGSLFGLVMQSLTLWFLGARRLFATDLCIEISERYQCS
jgi:hypothetical protein